MALTKKWKSFIKAYKADKTFWYLPHSHVGTEEFTDKFKVLATFQGKMWDDTKVMSAMRNKGLTKGDTAGARMLRKAIENLGLLWFESGKIFITPSGEALRSGKKKAEIIEPLLWKYQLDNPINDSVSGYRIFPHAVLIEILLAVDNKVTRDEFVLFVGRTKSRSDILETTNLIREWRKISAAQQNQITEKLDGEFVRRTTDASYVMGFHACARYLDRFKDERHRKGISLVPALIDRTTRKLAENLDNQWIDYGSKAECAAAFGDYEQAADISYSVDYYLDTSQYEKATEAFSKLPVNERRGKTEEEFKEELFLEKDLEDYLVNHLGKIEKGLKLIKRQRTVAVGTLDILARAKNKDLVVIELKKVRASDKVFGQLCRYMGCIAQDHNDNGKKVRGYIVGSEIDQKLRYAASVVEPGKIVLKWFHRNPDTPDIFVENDQPL
tara:strand:+ start:1395 stop:2717 length:1323 start_codon:yes stop_codon:yes gene_type:complete